MSNKNIDGQLKLDKFKIEVVNIFEKCLKEVTIEKYHEITSGIIKKNLVEKLRNVVEQSMLSFFVDSLMDNLEEINVVHTWDLLLKLELSSEKRTAWRPPGDVNNHMRSVRVNLKKKCIDEIECAIPIVDLNIKKLKENLEAFSDSAQNAVTLSSKICLSKDNYIEKNHYDFISLSLN